MKISKLFHWLYAILMLLPFAFFVPSVLYYAFNDNATMQSVEVPKTETISVDFNQLGNPRPNTEYGITVDFNGQTGQFSFTGNGAGNGPYVFRMPNVSDSRIGFNLENHHKYFVRSSLSYTEGVRIQAFVNNGYRSPVVNSIWGYDDIETTSFANVWFYGTNGAVIDVEDVYINVFDLSQMFGVGNEPTKEQFNSWFTDLYYPYTESELMQITYDTGETVQLVENTSIINYAWESIWDLPLFSWTKITFVSVPFSYLTGIFGIGASNSLNYVFGYFVTISIVWLVFDLLLYVPMLAHNWIDKARIE